MNSGGSGSLPSLNPKPNPSLAHSNKYQSQSASFRITQNPMSSLSSASSSSQAAAIDFTADKRLTRFFQLDKTPRKRLRTLLEFLKSASPPERSSFFSSHRESAWSVTLGTVDQYDKLKGDAFIREEKEGAAPDSPSSSSGLATTGRAGAGAGPTAANAASDDRGGPASGGGGGALEPQPTYKQGLLSRLGFVKKVGVDDWLDVLAVVGFVVDSVANEGSGACALLAPERGSNPSSSNSWRSGDVVDLLQKFLHPSNTQRVRKGALDALLRYCSAASAAEEAQPSSRPTELLRSAVLSGVEEACARSRAEAGGEKRPSAAAAPTPTPQQGGATVKRMFWNSGADKGKGATTGGASGASSADQAFHENDLDLLLQLLYFTLASQPISSSSSLSASDQQLASAVPSPSPPAARSSLTFSSFLPDAATITSLPAPTQYNPNTSTSSLELMYWSSFLCQHVFPLFFPFTSEQNGYATPPSSRGLRSCPLPILEVFEKWLDRAVSLGGAALDITWSAGASGRVVEEMLRQRFENLSAGPNASSDRRQAQALRTMKMYSAMGEGALTVPSHYAPKVGRLLIMMAEHGSEVLLLGGSIVTSPLYLQLVDSAVSLLEMPLERDMDSGGGEVFQQLLLHVVAQARLKENAVALEHSTRLIRCLFKLSAQNSDCTHGGGKDQTIRNLQEMMSRSDDELTSKIVVCEWRQQLLDLTKVAIWHIAVGNEGDVDVVKVNSRWSVGNTKWLKIGSARECVVILNRHLQILPPETMNALNPKLQTIVMRGVGDAVRVWINEAIVPDRHYKPPPRKGADKDQRNTSKERAKIEEVELKSKLLHIAPGTVLRMLGPWLFAGWDAHDKPAYREGSSIAIDSLMRLMCARTYANLGEDLENEICSRVRDALESEHGGTSIAAIRRMGDLFISDVPGVTGLVEKFLVVIERLLATDNSRAQSSLLLGNQTKMGVLNALCCVVTLCNTFGGISSDQEPSSPPLSSFKARIGDVFIAFANSAENDDSEWRSLCSTGIYMLLVDEFKSRDGNPIDETCVRHWVIAMCEWARSTTENAALSSLECLHDLAAIAPYFSGGEFNIHHELVLHLCGTTWNLIRQYYNNALVEFESKKRTILAGISSGSSGDAASKRDDELREAEESRNAALNIERQKCFNADPMINPGHSRRIIRAMECIESWVIHNPEHFLANEDICTRFCDILEAGMMSKLPDFTTATSKGAGSKYQVNNRLPKMLIQLRMDQHMEKQEMYVPVFSEVSETAEGIVMHLLNLLNNTDSTVNPNAPVDLPGVGKIDYGLDGGDDGISAVGAGAAAATSPLASGLYTSSTVATSSSSSSASSKTTDKAPLYMTYFDSVFFSLTQQNENGEGVIVIRDMTGAYSWTAKSEDAKLDIDQDMTMSVAQRRTKNAQYNASLCDSRPFDGERGSYGHSFINRGPAWAKTPTHSLFSVQSSTQGPAIGPFGSEPGDSFTYSDLGSIDMADGSGARRPFGHSDSNCSDTSMFDAPVLESDPVPPPPGKSAHRSSSVPPPRTSLPPPPPPPPESEGLKTTIVTGVSSPATTLYHTSAAAESEAASALTRKEALLNRMRGVPSKGNNQFTSNYDLSVDNMSKIIDALPGHSLSDDPTLLGGTWASTRKYEGDMDGSVVRPRPLDTALRVLHDDVLSIKFSKFLKQEYAFESYHFWKEVQGYKGNDKKGALMFAAQLLFDLFIKEGSEEQVNIPSKMVRAIETKMKSGVVDNSLFDDAEAEIVAMIARDKLPRFLAGSEEVCERVAIHEQCVATAIQINTFVASTLQKAATVAASTGGGDAKQDNSGAPKGVVLPATTTGAAAPSRHPLDVTRLFASQIGLLQPFSCSAFKVLEVEDDDKKWKGLMRNLRHLDSTHPRESIKVGVLFVSEGQTNQRDILANKIGSLQYERFVDDLGVSVDLKTHLGFNGKLDSKHFSNGRTMPYFADDKVEVAFHVATRMPTVTSDLQQVAKKRHIGNDFVHIVWSEHSRDYLPCTITSEFNDVVISLYPLKRARIGMVRVRITAKEGIRHFGPLCDGMLVKFDDLAQLVRQTAVNANRCLRELSPGYVKPYSERKKLIKEISVTYGTNFNAPSVFAKLLS